MQTKLLNDVISEIIGRQASDVIDLLIGKKDVNEFLLAKKLKLTINQVRNMLYKLANFNLVTFTRKKDRRKGWYTYFWTIDIRRALELLDKRLEKEIETLKNQLRSREIKRFYVCKTCKTEVSEEMALINNFSCSECGEIYELADNKKIIKELEKNIEKLERERKGVLEELEKVKEEGRKRAEKEAKKTKKKAKKKKKARKIRIKKMKRTKKKKIKKIKKMKKKVKKTKKKKKKEKNKKR